MRKSLKIIALSLIDSLEYKGNVFLYTLVGATQPLIILGVWLAVLSSGGNAPLTRAEFIQYFLLALIVRLWVSAWLAPYITLDIRLGKLSPYLLKPTSYTLFQFGNNLSEKIVKSIFLIPILLLLSIILKSGLPHLAISQWLVAIVSWALAAILMFFIDLSIGFSGFWLEESTSLEEFIDFFFFLLSGRLIPIFVLPLWLQVSSIYLPFRYTLSFPLEIMLNKLTTAGVIMGLSIQIAYCIAAALICRRLWDKGLKHYSAAGA